MRVPIPRLKLDLLGNALDSLDEGLRVFIGNTDPEQLTAVHLKRVILHLDLAIELTLKARLAREHFLLIYSTPEKCSDLSQTVTSESALSRLVAAGVPISDQEQSVLRGFRRLRNQIQHSEINASLLVLKQDIDGAIRFLDRFLRHELGTRLEERLSERDYLTLQKEVSDYEEALKLAQGELEADLQRLPGEQRSSTELLECDFCGQELVPSPDPTATKFAPIEFHCYFCGARSARYHPDADA